MPQKGVAPAAIRHDQETTAQATVVSRPAAFRSTVKLGVLLSNSKSRRAKLAADKLQALADLRLAWAAV
ncbi:hypothetical protein [Streptomyces sp. NPDC048155]|uniref:hypothetical protein n=1 Tax=Streptomyces sp. NPDC048155 TaxID=3154818 RepID=UPI0033FDE2E7